MKSIKLEVDALAVESFETTDGGGAVRGTVHAHGWTQEGETCDYHTCEPLYNSCGGVSYCIACHPDSHGCPYTIESVDWSCYHWCI